MNPIYIYVLTAVIVFFASMVRGTTGFGLAMIAMPILSIFMPYRETIILIVVLNLLFSVLHIFNSKGTISKRNLILTLLFGIVGVTLGAWLLKSVNPNIMKSFAGTIIILFGFSILTGLKIRLRNISIAFSAAALLGGIVAGAASIGGSVAALILGGTDLKQEKFRFAMSLFLLISYGFSTIMYGLSGMIERDHIPLIIFSIPFMGAGFFMGDRIAARINKNRFQVLVLLLLIISGSIITVQGIASLIK